MKYVEELAIDEVLDALKSGDRSVFNLVYNHYWDKLYLAAYSRLKNRIASEEVVQEVFLQLWIKRTTLDIRNLSAYLAAMTRYEVYKYLARESRIKERQNIWASAIKSELEVPTKIENKLLLEFIRELSNDLPEKCRLVFVQNKLEDRALKDVADSMDITQKTAEAHLTKALRFIRGKMHRYISMLLFFILFFFLCS